MLTLNITQCDVGIRLGRVSQVFLALVFKVGISNYDQLDVTFNGEQIPHHGFMLQRPSAYARQAIPLNQVTLPRCENGLYRVHMILKIIS